MQSNYARFLKPVFERADGTQLKTDEELSTVKSFTANLEEFQVEVAKVATKVPIPSEFNGKDYLTFLLYINAEIEHGLMIQYLYAGYSLGGSQVPEKHRAEVKNWQDIILGIAKEEMGHFISVQNILKLIGAPLNLGREDYPWDTPFYPFPFKLEPLSLASLAKYVYAESPEGWVDSTDPYAKEVKNLVHAQTNDPHRVGALFSTMMDLVNDTELIPDDVFESGTYPYQAKFDEWGRGYTGGQRGSAHHGQKGAPDVLVVPLTCRDDAYAALQEIAEQGEAPHKTENAGLPSHFERFLSIFKSMSDLQKKDPAFRPTRKVAINPFIPTSDEEAMTVKKAGTEYEQDPIVDPQSQLWAHLFNVRYRMLLNYLAHSFVLDDGFNNSGAISPRATIINATFGEMYNLRSISNVLVQAPLGGNSNKNAGPPFLIPYTLTLPMGEPNRWRVHKDVLEASALIVSSLLLKTTNEADLRYLHSLQEADARLLQIVDQLVSFK